MSDWTGFRSLDSADRRLLLRAGALMVALHGGVRLLPFVVVRRCLDRIAKNAERGANRGDTRDRIVWAVRAAGARLPATTCLMEALAADTMLRRAGYSSTVKIGVRRGASLSLDAHAWVECDGTPVIGMTPNLTEYARLT
jgi:hypothetical protein